MAGCLVAVVWEALRGLFGGWCGCVGGRAWDGNGLLPRCLTGCLARWAYGGGVSAGGEAIAERVAAAAARTVAAGTARLLFAWADGSPVPGVPDRRSEGVADFGARLARVSEAMLPERWTAKLRGDGDAGGPEHSESRDLRTSGVDAALRVAGRWFARHSGPRETIYDGANCYMRVGGRWTGFFLGDRDGPRAVNDPLWPLDALFGASGDAQEIGPDEVRGVPVTHCRLTVDLIRADAALPSGVSVPAGPYRRLRQLPAEVWLDEAGRARRIAVLAESPTPRTQIWTITELWDFGVAAGITVPGPEEIVAPRDATWDEPHGS